MLLLDTDVLILLAASGTMERVVDRHGCSIEEARRLPAALPQVRRNKRFRDNYGEAVLESVEAQISQISTVAGPKNLELLDEVGLLVDEGEAQLMAMAAEQEHSMFLSGDKRAVEALAASGPRSCVASMKGRIIVLEAILWDLIQAMGAPWVREAFLPVISHRTLSVVLSEHAVTDQARCLDGIRSYYDALHANASGLLFNPDPRQLGLSGRS